MERRKIFEIAYPKTGSRSMAEAMRVLGYRVTHGIGKPYRKDAAERALIWDFKWKLIDDYDYFGNVFAPFYSGVDRQHPGSAFILLVRDPRSWRGSCKAHHYLKKRSGMGQRVLSSPPDIMSIVRILMFGCMCGRDSDEVVKAYLDHNERVRVYFKDRPDDFLEINVCSGEGWGKLCRFLRVEEPGIVFPWEGVSKLPKTIRNREAILATRRREMEERLKSGAPAPPA